VRGVSEERKTFFVVAGRGSDQLYCCKTMLGVGGAGSSFGGGGGGGEHLMAVASGARSIISMLAQGGPGALGPLSGVWGSGGEAQEAHRDLAVISACCVSGC